MKLLLQISMCCLLAGSAMAQGHGGGGGRSGGGGFGGGRGSGGGGFGGGGGSFGGSGFRGGGRFFGGGNTFLHPTTRGGIGFFGGGAFYGGRGFYGRGFYGSSLYYPYFGLGLGYGGGLYEEPYYDPYYYGPGGYGGYASYQTSPNVTVIYPQQQLAAAEPPPERARPVTREYDQYGQEVKPGVPGAASPVFLIAFNDHVIRAAAAYWVDGKTLHYVTLQHEEKQAPLDTVDRSLSAQLNRERQIPFQLPAQ
jgi:hypothetical protein